MTKSQEYWKVQNGLTRGFPFDTHLKLIHMDMSWYTRVGLGCSIVEIRGPVQRSIVEPKVLMWFYWRWGCLILERYKVLRHSKLPLKALTTWVLSFPWG